LIVCKIGVHETARYTIIADGDGRLLHRGYRAVAEAVHRHGTVLSGSCSIPAVNCGSRRGVLSVAYAPLFRPERTLSRHASSAEKAH